MGNFKVGDRVRITDDCYQNFGKNGTVVQIVNVDGYICFGVRLDDDKSSGPLNYYPQNSLAIITTRVIINPPAVILFKDGKRYVAKAQDEPFNAERGLTIALLRSFGIGYSDLQKMLKEAKYQKKVDNAETILNRPLTSNFSGNYIDGLIPNEWIDETMIKRPIDNQKQYVNASSIDNDNDGFFAYAMKILYGNRGKQSTRNKNATEIKIQKPKRGRPRKIVKDETPKPKRPVGRPRKSQLQYKVGDYVLVNGLFYQIKAFSEDKKKVFLYDARNQTITEHDVSEIMRVQK